MERRKIIFKAKKLSDGKWVNGDLLHRVNKTYIYKPHINERGFFVETEAVDPLTVCQFTGLKDCEGNEIWECDMLSNVTNDSPDGIVVFKYGAFSLLAKNGRDFCVALTYLMSEKDSLNRFKVVGNKFDKEK